MTINLGTRTVEVNARFDSIVIDRIDNGLKATLTYSIFDEGGNYVNKDVITYEGQEFNTFWAEWNSGTYLYKKILEKNNVEAEVAEALENEFLNN